MESKFTPEELQPIGYLLYLLLVPNDSESCLDTLKPAVILAMLDTALLEASEEAIGKLAALVGYWLEGLVVYPALAFQAMENTIKSA